MLNWTFVVRIELLTYFCLLVHFYLPTNQFGWQVQNREWKKKNGKNYVLVLMRRFRALLRQNESWTIFTTATHSFSQIVHVLFSLFTCSCYCCCCCFCSAHSFVRISGQCAPIDNKPTIKWIVFVLHTNKKKRQEVERKEYTVANNEEKDWCEFQHQTKEQTRNGPNSNFFSCTFAQTNRRLYINSEKIKLKLKISLNIMFGWRWSIHV